MDRAPRRKAAGRRIYLRAADDHRTAQLDSGAYVSNSATISAAIALACSSSPGLRLMAPTRAWPPPPYRSQMVARLCFGSSAAQGFEPTEILVRKLEGLTDTV